MKTRTEPSIRRSDSGFILATVLVFLIVLSLTAFLSAKLTRSDIQVVNNLQNEKEALAIAEAGVHEALYRLNLPAGDRATITGINSGNAFTASVTPSATPTWNTQIVFTTSAPSTSGSTVTAPSLQPISTSRLPYTDPPGGTNPFLTVAWDLCTNSTDVGCSGYPTEQRRQLPLSSPRSVIKITATGQSGTARRQITAKAVDCVDSGAGGPGSITSLSQSCSNNVSLNGGNSISAAGAVTINAGATSNPPSSCTSAQTGGSTSNITAGSINTVGGYSGNLNPTPTTGVLAVSDPYADPLMRPPCFTGGPTPCQGTTITTIQYGTAANPPNSPMSVGNNVTLNPGIYYGGILINGTNVHMNPGVYVIAGGGFAASNGTTSVASNTTGGDGTGGVMIFNTQDYQHTGGGGAIDNFDLSNGNTTASIAAPTSGTFAGVVLYQDRSLASQPTVLISGGNSSRVLDGLVYAPNALMTVQGGSPSGTTIGGSLVVASISMTGNTTLTVQEPGTPPPTPGCGGIAYVPIGWQDF